MKEQEYTDVRDLSNLKHAIAMLGDICAGNQPSIPDDEYRVNDQDHLDEMFEPITIFSIKQRSHGNRGTKEGYLSEMGWEPEVEADPTDAQPGSDEKLALLAARVENGQPLWHDGDATALPSVGELTGRESPPMGMAARDRSRRGGIHD